MAHYIERYTAGSGKLQLHPPQPNDLGRDHAPLTYIDQRLLHAASAVDCVASQRELESVSLGGPMAVARVA